MGVEPKTGGKPPKWMVKIMENPIKIHDLGVPLFLETSIYKKNYKQVKGVNPIDITMVTNHFIYFIFPKCAPKTCQKSYRIPYYPKNYLPNDSGVKI